MLLLMSGPKYFIFKGELHGLMYQILSVDLLIPCRYPPVYRYQSKQSLSKTELCRMDFSET